MAFKQDEPVDREWRTSEPSVGRGEAVRHAAVAAETGERDVRKIGTVVRREAGGYAGAINFGVELRERLSRLHPDP